MGEISEYDEFVDVRDVIARVEELEPEVAELLGVDDEQEKIAAAIEGSNHDECQELRQLYELLDDLRGGGGDEQWRGDWYPVSLISDCYFENYARELAEDIGAIDAHANWPLTHIDWKAAAEELQMDYSSVEFRGVTFWFR